MVQRRFWQARLEKACESRSVVWLSGVRRTGKTFLCQSLEGVEYFDCELPRVRRTMEDPEAFLDGLRKKRVVLDEIHRLANPSELLKIAADHYPDVRIIAAGSSTLGASARFRDTLAWRKAELWLTPMISADLAEFGNTDLDHRFLHGGLPPFFLADEVSDRDFQEWMDAYWAKDILELFRLERRSSFQRFFELLMAQSGGIFEASSFATPCEVSRATIANYLAVLDATFVVHVVRPYHTHRATELVAAPKVYGFDTGFVCCYRGWSHLRPEDRGLCWKHYVLNEICGRSGHRNIQYWRDKRKHEIDFVLSGRARAPLALECKWSASDFSPDGMSAFRRLYPQGDNWVIASDVDRPYRRAYNGIDVQFGGLSDFINAIMRPPLSARKHASE